MIHISKNYNPKTYAINIFQSNKSQLGCGFITRRFELFPKFLIYLISYINHT